MNERDKFAGFFFRIGTKSLGGFDLGSVVKPETYLFLWPYDVINCLTVMKS
jgi:hypothetical protein